MYVRESLSAATQATYRSGLNSYQRFCFESGHSPFPPIEELVCAYVSHMAGLVSHRTIKVYLAGVQYHCNVNGWNVRLSDMRRLHYVLRGIQRVQGQRFSRPRRAPITIRHLFQIIQFLGRHNLTYHDQVVYTAASLLAFFGLLRVSEYTCSSARGFDSSIHLGLQDVIISGQVAQVRLKASKTDPFRVGTTVRVPSLNSVLCPVSALRRYIHLRGRRAGPFFILHNNNFLTRHDMHWLLTHALDNAHINTHSFRIGGATAAAAAGCADSVIQILGRWSSDAFREYLRLSNCSILDIGNRMIRADSQSLTWQPDS